MTPMTLQSRRKKQYTDLVFEDEIRSSVRSVKSEIAEILHSLRDSTAVFLYQRQIVTATPVDFLRLLAEWKTSTKVQHSVKNIVTSAFFSAEEKCAGSALLGAGCWVSGVKFLPMTKKRCRSAEMNRCLSYMGGGGMARAAASAVIELGGLGCRVDFEETPSSVTRVLARSGKEILGEVDPLFSDRVGRKFDLQNCLAIAVRGTVESVASLHSALVASAGTPVIVLAEHFLPDVANTMSETWIAGRGKCLPFVVKNWGVENFLDLEVQGVRCASDERGDTILGLKLESSKSFDVSVDGETCTISNGNSNSNSKLTVEVSQTLGGLTGLAKDRVKMLVGHARLCARNGVIEWERLRKESQDLSYLYSGGFAISSVAAAAGSRTAESLEKVLQELGCLIMITKGEES
jgi:hypothetical protein